MSSSTLVDTNPETTQDNVADAALLRKIDWRLIPFLSYLYLFCFLDRANIGNARAAGLNASGLGNMERDLGMTTLSQYNWALSAFFIGYILFEVPSNIMLKITTPRIWIARIMVTWGICATCMAFVQNFAGLVALRVLLGICEAGFYPGVLYYLSYWYRPQELAWRVGIFFSAASVAGAFGGVFAYYLVQVNAGFIAGWRAIFLFEGIPSILNAGLVYFFLPNYPQDAGFLTEFERKYAVERLAKEGIDSTETHYDRKQLFAALTDPKVVMFSFIYLGILTPTYGFTFYLPTLIKMLGYSALNAQLFSSIPYVVASTVVVVLTFTSDRFKDRSIHIISLLVIQIVCFLGLGLYRNDADQKTVLFTFLCFAVMAVYGSVPIQCVWILNNMNGQTKTAVAAAIMVGFGNLGGIIGPQVFQPSDAPSLYKNGSFIMIGFSLWALVWTVALRLYLIREKNLAARNVGSKEGEFAVADVIQL
ncbi:UNVERIFIED_CONTAM: hypothetical protein HDU68_010573 [Siphonaria sp. JEL0065]|nr:hypothetical protein HDU68_010573 [Siphonaria sp. JEL0065]